MTEHERAVAKALEAIPDADLDECADGETWAKDWVVSLCKAVREQRRGEPSPPLFEGEPERCSLCQEPGHTHDDHWLFQHEPVKALQAAYHNERRRADYHQGAADNLRAELQKYEPSDGVMQQRLAMTEAIREAARLIERVTADDFGTTPIAEAIWVDAKAWLALPVVKAARKEPG